MPVFVTTLDHDHVFGQDDVRAGERRTILVLLITAAMMIVEISAGIAYGSMALLADGLHMGSHAAALGIAALAYIYARRMAADKRFSFGTGKVNALAGFSGAIMLAGFALVMVWESSKRLLEPVPIVFDQAIIVAVVGLVVNAVCAVVLSGGQMLGRGRSRGAAQGIALDDAPGGARDVGPGGTPGGARGSTHGGDALDDDHADHNLRSAYLHVLADAMTSVAAIGALVAGKYFGANWMDPFMGIAGAILVSRWSIGLVKQSSAVLLDQQAPQEVIESIRRAIEEYEENTVTDVHVWSIGPAIYAAEIWLFTDAPRSAGWYKSLLPDDLGLVHVTVEVHYDDGTSGAAGRRGLTELRRLDDDEKGAA